MQTSTQGKQIKTCKALFHFFNHDAGPEMMPETSSTEPAPGLGRTSPSCSHQRAGGPGVRQRVLWPGWTSEPPPSLVSERSCGKLQKVHTAPSAVLGTPRGPKHCASCTVSGG